MKVLVCGGRSLTDTELVYRFLDHLHKTRMIGVVIEGGARGADRIAGYWARKNRIDNRKYYADWDNITHPQAVVRVHRTTGKKYDAAAGGRRNQLMLDEGKPDLVVAFPGGLGTADMVKRARAAGVDVVEVPKHWRVG